MKKIIVLTIVIVVTLSCKSQQENQWTLAYRANVFCSCLKNLDVQIENDATPSLNFQIIGELSVIKETDSLGKYIQILSEKEMFGTRGEI